MAKKLSVADRLSQVLSNFVTRRQVHDALRKLDIHRSVASMRTADARGRGIGVYMIHNSTAYYTKEAVLVWAEREYPSWLTTSILKVQLT